MKYNRIFLPCSTEDATLDATDDFLINDTSSISPSSSSSSSSTSLTDSSTSREKNSMIQSNKVQKSHGNVHFA